MSEKGNKPQPEDNYVNWPGLVRVVNDSSRAFLFWVNGDETLSYRGDTAALNRVLQEFGQVQAAELHIVLRPAPLAAAAKAEDKEAPYDCQLHIVGGIARAMVEHERTGSVVDWHPTLTVFVSKRIDVNALLVPKNATILQLEDLKVQYSAALQVGNDESKFAAAQFLDRLNADAARGDEAAREFQRQVDEIRACVEKWEAAK